MASLYQDDTIDFYCNRLLSQYFQVAREHNLLAGIDGLSTEQDWTALLPLFKEGWGLAPKGSTDMSTLPLNDIITLGDALISKYPMLAKRYEALDNQRTPENATTSKHIALSENNTTPDIITNPDTATPLEYDEIPESVKELYPSFPSWTSDPISFWRQKFPVDPSQKHVTNNYRCLFEALSPMKPLQHRFRCVVGYLFFNLDNQPSQHITKIRLRQHLQKSDVSADHDSYFLDLIKTGRRCVEFCQQLQPDRHAVDYGPILRLDIPDIIWKSQSTHSRKKFKIFLDKMRSQNISKWSKESGAQSAAKAIINVFLHDDELPLHLSPS
ncbi:hypothetical protein J3F84DRAFT_381211 [Trichoderma pleuroticola]